MTRNTFEAKGDAEQLEEILKRLDISSEEFAEAIAKPGDPEVLLRYTDSELMKELERRFMDRKNLKGNKIWAWMNNYSCDNDVMAMYGERGRLKNELKKEEETDGNNTG